MICTQSLSNIVSRVAQQKPPLTHGLQDGLSPAGGPHATSVSSQDGWGMVSPHGTPTGHTNPRHLLAHLPHKT